ncbi:hypothetical protein [Halodesulfovibrio sp.]|uniref:hypothetical protein n=1 Tax=Halodesulfovibrio sp. TaxID=1912772 RepID=UPI0025C613B0|nr:hypothetical protein [Halodesulfovibrio sp.]
MDELLANLKAELPPVFAGKEIDRLLGKAICWRTIQNIRSKKDLPDHKKIPRTCFVRSGDRKTLIIRDPFLEWWISQLTID